MAVVVVSSPFGRGCILLQDAHEFLCEVLDIIKEETIALAKKCYDKNTGRPIAAPNPSTDNFEFQVCISSSGSDV